MKYKYGCKSVKYCIMRLRNHNRRTSSFAPFPQLPLLCMVISTSHACCIVSMIRFIYYTPDWKWAHPISLPSLQGKRQFLSWFSGRQYQTQSSSCCIHTSQSHLSIRIKYSSATVILLCTYQPFHWQSSNVLIKFCLFISAIQLPSVGN